MSHACHQLTEAGHFGGVNQASLGVTDLVVGLFQLLDLILQGFLRFEGSARKIIEAFGQQTQFGFVGGGNLQQGAIEVGTFNCR